MGQFMSSPLTDARSAIESSIAASLVGWGKVVPIREALNLTYPQQATHLGPRWGVLEWMEARPESWGPGLEGQSQDVRLWLIDRGSTLERMAEGEDLVRARFEAAFGALSDSLLALEIPIDSLRLDFGPTDPPLRKLAESRENPHLALFTCQASVVWQISTA